ncbi:MAG: hypothetical protein Q9169_007524 [Polycauliona sp. 2 TL-2023]
MSILRNISRRTLPQIVPPPAFYAISHAAGKRLGQLVNSTKRGEPQCLRMWQWQGGMLTFCRAFSITMKKMAWEKMVGDKAQFEDDKKKFLRSRGEPDNPPCIKLPNTITMPKAKLETPTTKVQQDKFSSKPPRKKALETVRGAWNALTNGKHPLFILGAAVLVIAVPVVVKAMKAIDVFRSLVDSLKALSPADLWRRFKRICERGCKGLKEVPGWMKERFNWKMVKEMPRWLGRKIENGSEGVRKRWKKTPEETRLRKEKEASAPPDSNPSRWRNKVGTLWAKASGENKNRTGYKREPEVSDDKSSKP